MDNKDYSGLLLQNITRSLPSSKIEDNWQACSRSRGFSQTKSQETTANTSLPPTNAIITSSCSGFNAEYPSSFLVTKLHFLLCRVDCQRMIWTVLWMSYTRRSGHMSTRIVGVICDVNRILQSDWRRTISFMWQTQNLVLVCNPTIHTRDMLGSAQLTTALQKVCGCDTYSTLKDGK